MKHCLSFLSVVLLCVVATTSSAQDTKRKLYILHGEGHGISVVDVATNKIIKNIEVGKEPHGVAAPDSQDRLWVTVEGDGDMVVIDTRTDEIIKRYDSIGTRPHENDITGDGRLVYIPFMGDGVYRVFDTEKEKVIAEIPTPGFPHNVVFSPDDKLAYLSPMDLENRPVAALKAAGYPTSENRFVYIVDTTTHKVVGKIDVGDAPRPITVNPNGKHLYINIDGFQGIHVLDPKTLKVVARAPYALTEREKAKPSRTHGLWATPDGKEVWTCDVNHGVIFCFDVTQTPPVEVARVETKKPTYWLTGSPDGKTLYAASPPENAVTVIDIKSRTITDVIATPAGSGPKRMLVVDVPTE